MTFVTENRNRRIEVFDAFCVQEMSSDMSTRRFCGGTKKGVEI